MSNIGAINQFEGTIFLCNLQSTSGIQTAL